jgi:hypothetical protein
MKAFQDPQEYCRYLEQQILDLQRRFIPPNAEHRIRTLENAFFGNAGSLQQLREENGRLRDQVASLTFERDLAEKRRKANAQYWSERITYWIEVAREAETRANDLTNKKA